MIAEEDDVIILWYQRKTLGNERVMEQAGKGMKDFNSWKETKRAPEVGVMLQEGTRKGRWEEGLAMNVSACLLAPR